MKYGISRGAYDAMLGTPTTAELLAQAARTLAQAGVDTPYLDAELLLAHALGVDRAWVLAHPEAIPSADVSQRFQALIARRSHREPLPYITGQRFFFDLELKVTPDTLIPRWETEELVERALAWLATRPQARVVDVGTGSGAIALAVAKHARQAHVYATELSPAALEVARENAQRLGLAHRVQFLLGDLLTPLPQPVDLILANLPYVAQKDRAQLMPEVRDFEPPLALYGGEKGLDLLARLLAQAPDYLRPQGAVWMEIGDRQGPHVLALARRHFPQAAIQVHKDLAGRPRFLSIQITCRKP